MAEYIIIGFIISALGAYFDIEFFKAVGVLMFIGLLWMMRKTSKG